MFKKTRIYCAFLDLEKAFDKINRTFLWQKLLNMNLDGKLLTVIKNMYAAAKSCVMVDDNYTDFFSVSRGVRQGDSLSPVLFAMFLNDMKEFINGSMPAD